MVCILLFFHFCVSLYFNAGFPFSLTNIVIGGENMEHTVYNTNLHLVEIEKVRAMGNMGTSTEVWAWEITIADKGTVYKGKAIVQNRNIHLPWMELQTINPLTEMIDACKRYMDND